MASFIFSTPNVCVALSNDLSSWGFAMKGVTEPYTEGQIREITTMVQGKRFHRALFRALAARKRQDSWHYIMRRLEENLYRKSREYVQDKKREEAILAMDRELREIEKDRQRKYLFPSMPTDFQIKSNDGLILRHSTSYHGSAVQLLRPIEGSPNCEILNRWEYGQFQPGKDQNEAMGLAAVITDRDWQAQNAATEAWMEQHMEQWLEVLSRHINWEGKKVTFSFE